MSFFYSDSKTDLKLRCDYCVNFQVFEGTQDIFSRLTAVCCMLLSHNPYRLPQHYKRHVCGPSHSCKHWFLWTFWALVLSELYGYNTPLKTFLVNSWCSFGRPVLIFQPTLDSSASDNRASCVCYCISQLREQCSCYVLTYKSGFWRGSILVPKRNPDLHGSCSLPKHCGISDRSEQNSSKIW